ncbi:metallophosphoesterase [Uliginosibacterium sp. sgz301328]|uniref:metallophosphoesterase family protein n=1 Tax=Uliginosibacterium sp. sgz301328 TaxID=3243764 RepID=UPI00359D070A
MKIALLSDIHANRQALDACLTHAYAQGAERLALLGDIVGYGGDPQAVVERVMELAAGGAIVIQGNHDAMAVSPPVDAETIGELGAQWTHDNLSEAHRDFLAGLPLHARWGHALFVHASADHPEQWRYVLDGAAAERSMDAAASMDSAIRYVFCGHVHQQALYFVTPTAKLMRFAPQPGVAIPVLPHRQWLAIAGSVGQPRDGDTRAMYAMFDDEPARLTFHRVPYDFEAAARAIRATPLPAFFADRLEAGL